MSSSTEDEAREKWCPFSITGYNGIGLNRMSEGRSDHKAGIEHDTRCVASKCMAWRWLEQKRMFGYCGLADSSINFPKRGTT